MKKKVLLINSNQEINPNPVLPIGMAYVASSLDRSGFSVSCADLCFKPKWQNYLKQKLQTFSPDFIGISIRNIDNHDHSKPKLYLDFTREVIEFCRQHSGAEIFCGGAAMAVMPGLILDYLGLDYGIFGDGEEASPQLLKNWGNQQTLSTLAGLVYKSNGRTVTNPAKGVEDIGTLPYNEIPRWIDVKPYFRQETSYPVQAKRGCPFDCIYCTYAKGEGKCYRLRTPESVAREVIEIDRKYHPKTIEFVDSIFNHPPGFAEDVCRALIQQKSLAKLHTIELNPAFLTPELISLMEKAGFVSCGITCESASEKILTNFKKSYSAKDVFLAARNLKNSKMKKLWVFLMGGPGEDAETVEETLRFVREELGKNDIVFFNIGIRIYPKTEMESIARQEGLLKENDTLLYPSFYLSPKISRQEIENRIIAEKNVNIVTIKDLRLPYLSSLLKIAGFLQLKGPYWAYTPIFNRIRNLLWLK